MIEKRYQVFISSTFADLKEERQAVLKAVLELGHMPAGMELFPAADDSAWQLIRDVIDASDYYVVILGGRYGSVDETGIGYTEREYEHAIQARKPVIPLLHQNPDNLPRDKTDKDEGAWKRLVAFRAIIEKRHTCVYWKNTDELKVQVILGVTSALKRSPAIGWIRADQIPTDATVAEVLDLRNKIAALQNAAEESRVAPPNGTEDLQQGDDEFRIGVEYVARDPATRESRSYTHSIDLSWNLLFSAVAPLMISEASDADVRRALKGSIAQQYRSAHEKDRDLKGKELAQFSFPDDSLDTCIVQFRALGLIKSSIRPRSVKDSAAYWCLTPYGDYLMTQLLAIKKDLKEDDEDSEEEAGATDDS